MLILKNLAYAHPNKDLLFSDFNLTVGNMEKVALIGNNGVGKSTLLKIIAGELQPSEGQIEVEAEPYYMPQIFGQFNHLTIAQALNIEDKLSAFGKILNGNTSEENFTLLNDDWTIEERCKEALNFWNLNELDLFEKMGKLSGGQKTKIFLAGIAIHQPKVILMDEPTNHLDLSARLLFYDFVEAVKSTLIVVSHDRRLLNLFQKTLELNTVGIKTYGGNFDFYSEQKKIEDAALTQGVQNTEKALRKAKAKERETLARQQKLDARGKGKQEKAGVARIMMNTLRNSAEKSTSKLKSVHTEKIAGIHKELNELRSSLPDISTINFGLDSSALHRGKTLVTATQLNYGYHDQALWKHQLNFQITSGERIVLKGMNGSGKTTLIQLILGNLRPQTGSLRTADCKAVYLDQEYSLLDDNRTVYEQAAGLNIAALEEHEVKIRLHRFLFTKNDWDKKCEVLSGGERMRLSLCCLTLDRKSPDLIVFDEPTNNLDIQNIEILTSAINQYQGTIIVVSHDEVFLEQINIQREIHL
ncbi:ribosomal protection-like ABC-F family protein [Niabella insulamsoli]|uniref:ribosomal protection-like ABC-F family protein n=1 Tax=Niabella insulamsoli TaxID=3144874 RepID=UPI0031FDE5AE